MPPVPEDEILLGFDARVAPAAEPWPRDRETVYQLRSTPHQPLSVDRFVWDRAVMAWESDFAWPPFWQHGTIWPSYPLMATAIVRAGLSKPPWQLALTISAQSRARDQVWWDGMLKTLRELPAGSRWQLLGYDVATASLLSGLLNCGYRPNERRRLARRFGSLLNDWHLLESRQAADEFALETQRRIVDDHGVFSALGIYRMIEPPEAK